MTAGWRTREELVHQIVRLKRDGLSRRAITGAVGVSRNTVKAVLAAHEVEREKAPGASLAPRRCSEPGSRHAVLGLLLGPVVRRRMSSR